MSRASRRKPSATPLASPTTAAEPETTRQAAELAAFRRMLIASEGTFSLSFAICNSRTLRDELIGQFTREFPDIAAVELAPDTADVLDAAVQRLGNATPRAIFVLGLEDSLSHSAKTYPVLRTLNASRELWERYRCPVVFWVAEFASVLLSTKAVDFWRYRSHTFEFVAPSLDAGQWQTESFRGQAMTHGLPYDEKRFRRAELEQRILQAGPSPSGQMLPHVLDWMFELAELHQVFNDYQSAEILLRDVVRLSEEEYGLEATQSATAVSNLATLLQATNRLAEAEPLMRRALAIDEKSYGAEHPDIARDLNNLAWLLKDTNRLAEAEPLMRRALAIDEQSYGAEHPHVAIRLNNLAQLLQATNRLAAAEPLMRRALAIDEKSYGAEHPDVARDLNNLAALLQAMNRLAEAEPLIRRALAIDGQSYGAKHPKVAIHLNNLAQLLQATNRLAEAEPLMRRALAIDEQSYGAEHPDVAIDLNNLALLLQATNRLAEAEPLMRRALAIDEQSYGAEHPDVAIDLNNLAQLLQATNRLADAEPLMRRALAILITFRRHTGHEHPRYQRYFANFTALLKALGRSPDEIVTALRELVEE